MALRAPYTAGEESSGATLPTVEDLAPRRSDARRVVIVGAGMAGLSAAHQLRTAGHHVTVLEARTRPGGRVHTVREPFSDGLYAEAGALFLPSDHPFLMKYVDLTGLTGELVPVTPAELGGFYFIRGQRILCGETGPERWPLALTEEEQALGLDGMLRKYIGGLAGGDVTGPDWPPEHLRRYDEMSLLDGLREQGASPDATDLLRVAYWAGLGDVGRDLSMLFVLQQYHDVAELGVTGAWNTLRGGNDRLPRGLALLLRDSIEYAAEVVAIEHDDRRVRVTVRQRGGQNAIEADHVICALPFACLREISISPDLSPAKRRAVDGLRSTSVGHLFVQSRRRTWRTGSRGLFAMGPTDLPLAWTVRDATFNQEGPRGVLDAYMTGSHNDAVLEMDDAQRESHALQYMEDLAPGLRDEYENVTFMSWTDDRWSRGDYVWYRPHEFTAFWPHVARPEGRIHFAGDQTSALSGWQEGAISSGHRAAREVAEAAS